MTTSRYTVSKLIVADLVTIERTDRFSHKLGRTPFTPVLVRELHAAGATSAYLADRFGCTPRAINQCVSRTTYKNLA